MHKHKIQPISADNIAGPIISDISNRNISVIPEGLTTEQSLLLPAFCLWRVTALEMILHSSVMNLDLHTHSMSPHLHNIHTITLYNIHIHGLDSQSRYKPLIWNIKAISQEREQVTVDFTPGRGKIKVTCDLQWLIASLKLEQLELTALARKCQFVCGAERALTILCYLLSVLGNIT